MIKLINKYLAFFHFSVTTLSLLQLGVYKIPCSLTFFLDHGEIH